jgi:hypothetical protein
MPLRDSQFPGCRAVGAIELRMRACRQRTDFFVFALMAFSVFAFSVFAFFVFALNFALAFVRPVDVLNLGADVLVSGEVVVVGAWCWHLPSTSVP